MRTPLLKGRPGSNKQPAGLKLTSMSGRQTFYEVPLRANRGKRSLYLIDTKANYIMDINKPIDFWYRFSCQGTG